MVKIIKDGLVVDGSVIRNEKDVLVQVGEELYRGIEEDDRIEVYGYKVVDSIELSDWKAYIEEVEKGKYWISILLKDGGTWDSNLIIDSWKKVDEKGIEVVVGDGKEYINKEWMIELAEEVDGIDLREYL